MSAAVEHARQRRDAILKELAELDSSRAGGRPTAHGGDASADHVGYKDGLLRELQLLHELFPALREDAATKPFEIHVRGF